MDLPASGSQLFIKPIITFDKSTLRSRPLFTSAKARKPLRFLLHPEAPRTGVEQRGAVRQVAGKAETMADAGSIT